MYQFARLGFVQERDQQKSIQLLAKDQQSPTAFSSGKPTGGLVKVNAQNTLNFVNILP